ncbi:MAG: glycosyltransferase family 2 protein [Saprospiraceae bacterium]|nr:glycosyltransferase family 2 protein [Saprospiraceae bacterium]
MEADLEQSPNLVVVIPAYKENLTSLKTCLDSLDVAAHGHDSIAVFVLINYKASDSDKVKHDSSALFEDLRNHSCTHLILKVFKQEFFHKKGGVGLARKTLMDAAFSIFNERKKDGLIINLDADTIVAPNYFQEIKKHFTICPKCQAANIHFEHLLSEDNQLNSAIINYELHLRYFINMQRLICLPYAFQTIGSAMVVRAFSYAKEGGMVKKQAGEDFYFLHKFSKNHQLMDIQTTCVYPSNRKSDRVPFGTGKAVNDIISSEQAYQTYNPKSFNILSDWFLQIFKSYEKGADLVHHSDNVTFNTYLESIHAKDKISEIESNISDINGFIKRFFVWFDAFALMKYLHYMRDHGYDDINIPQAIESLLNTLNLPHESDALEQLKTLRAFDKESVYFNQWRAALISRLSNISAS